MKNYNFSDMAKHAIFTAQTYGTKTTVEIDHSDLDLDEVMDAFQTLLNGMGYHSDTFKQWVLERAAEYQEEEDEKWDDIKAEMEQDDDMYENLRHSTDDVSEWDSTLNDGLEDNEELPEWMLPNEELKNAVEEFRKEVKKKRNKK